jgi:hypothetical protein
MDGGTQSPTSGKPNFVIFVDEVHNDWVLLKWSLVPPTCGINLRVSLFWVKGYLLGLARERMTRIRN